MHATRLHRALASDRRVRVLDLLRESADGLDADALAVRLGLHPNTVRSHLDRLIEAGLVSSRPERDGRRGRPRRVYGLAARDADAVLLDLLEAQGFEPEQRGDELLLRRCPFPRRGAVCAAHAQLLSAIAGVELDVRPGRDACAIRTAA